MAYIGNQPADIGVYAVQSETGNGVLTAFTLNRAATTASISISIDGVDQIPTTAYAVTVGTTLTFTSAPPNLSVISIRFLGDTVSFGEPSTGSVTNAHIDASAAIAQSKLVNIVDADIDASAAIGAGKLASTLNLASKTVTLPAASVTAHVTAFDDTPVRRDIATLALHTAISDNKAAYNLSNAFIDQFEDGTGIASHSTSYRVSEYVSTDNRVTETLGYGDTLTIVYTAGGVATFDSAAEKLLIENNATDIYSTYHQNPTTGSPGYTIMDMTTAVTLVKAEFFNFNTNARINDVSLQYSTDNSSWTTVPASGVTGGGSLNGSYVLSGINSNAWYGFSFTGIEARYWRFKVDAIYNNGNTNGGIAEVRFVDSVRGSQSAAGNFISTTQASTASVSTAGIVVLYKNNSGTASLNTDIVAEVSANGGTNYANATLVAGGTFSTGINIAAVSGVSVTAGTTPKYRISFANQVAGSKDTQVHGVALLY